MDESAVMDAKLVFADEAGKRMLARLKTICRADNRQSLFVADNINQTNYNLGSNAVYRYIISLMETNLNEVANDGKTLMNTSTGEEP